MESKDAPSNEVTELLRLVIARMDLQDQRIASLSAETELRRDREYAMKLAAEQVPDPSSIMATPTVREMRPPLNYPTIERMNIAPSPKSTSSHRLPSEDRDFEERVREPRRETLYHKVANPIIPNAIVPMVHRSLPSYSHIKLERLNINSVLLFMGQIREYESEHCITLPIHTLIKETPKNLILADLSMDYADSIFNTLPRDTIFQVMREHVRPRTKRSFIEALKYKIDLNWPDNYVISAVHFKVAYERYRVYKRLFIQRYDFIAEDNEDKIPDLTDREDGLITIFLAGINKFNYTSELYKRIPTEVKKTFKNREGFTLFLKAFYDMMDDDYHSYLKAHELAENMRDQKKSSAAEQQSPAVKKEQYTRTYNRPRDNRPLHMIEESVVSEDRRTHENRVEEVPNSDDEGNNEAVQNPQDFVFESTEYDELAETIAKTSELSAIASSELPSGFCFRMLLNGECSRGDKCKYPHDNEAMTRAFYSFYESLKKSKYCPRNITLPSIHRPPGNYSNNPKPAGRIQAETQILKRNVNNNVKPRNLHNLEDSKDEESDTNPQSMT